MTNRFLAKDGLPLKPKLRNEPKDAHPCFLLVTRYRSTRARNYETNPRGLFKTDSMPGLSASRDSSGRIEAAHRCARQPHTRHGLPAEAL
jgi:hypothetical protein